MDSKRSSSSEADCEPLAKRPQALLSRKVCIVCFSSSGESDAAYNIYIVDLNSGGGGGGGDSVDEFKFTPTAPTLALDPGCFPANAFCVLGSTLYMFEQYDRDTANPQGRKSVFTFDLSSVDLTKSNIKLEKSMLGKAPDMLHPKRNPIAIPTSDGKKILVFSSLLYYDKGDFELYDPANGSSEQLPIINRKTHSITYNPYSLWIEAYAFISKSVFLVQTESGIFALDFESLEKGWELWYYFRGVEHIRRSSFVIEDRFFFIPGAVYDLGEEDGLGTRAFRFPLSSFAVGYVPKLALHSITLLDHDNDNGECNFCVLQTGHDEDKAEYAHLIIDVGRTDLNKYKEDKAEMRDTSALTNTSIVKSLKFVLDVEQHGWFTPLCFSSI